MLFEDEVMQEGAPVEAPEVPGEELPEEPATVEEGEETKEEEAAA